MLLPNPKSLQQHNSFCRHWSVLEVFQNLVLPLAGPNDHDLFTFRQAGEGHISVLAECFGARGLIHSINSDTTPYDVSLRKMSN